MSQRRSQLPAWGSATARVLLGAWALVLLVTLFPENLRTWDDPNASVLPSERTMPAWGNLAMMAIMVVTAVALAVGWRARRRLDRQAPRAAQVLTWATVAGQLAWAGVLIASLVVSMAPAAEEAVIGTGPGIVLDGFAGLVALATAFVAARDAIHLRRTADAAGTG
ncbi:hypothetical protein [Demequina globuliformis]|uniref:hypothetical protein n=1 Tax=Demequina globuliformis TaxID=676202 RepID=UPI00128E03DA|nr:hypothetical protein [Demequina globuliformis]